MSLQIELLPPKDMPRFGPVNSDIRQKWTDRVCADGELLLRYEFRLRCGEIKALLETLQEISCTAHITVRSLRGENSITGHIHAWNEDSLILARNASAELQRRVDRITGFNGCILNYELILTRSIVR